MGIDDILAQQRDAILRLAARHGASNVRVFGSVARGDADRQSDVDFLVEMASGRSLEELLGRRVDVVTEKGLRERIRERVLQEALPL